MSLEEVEVNLTSDFFFSGSQSSVTVTQSPLPAKCDASDDADGGEAF